ADIFEMRGFGSRGENEWSREMAIATDHQAGVKTVSVLKGTAIAGPSERADRISLTYLGADGELLWQRTFSAYAEHPDIWLEPNKDGSVFIATRAATDRGLQTYSIMKIDANGQDLWRTPMIVDKDTLLAGLAAYGDGGVYALSSGKVPVLTKFDTYGATAWSVDVPQAKFSSSTSLIAAPNGNAVVAVSYAIASQNLDVWLEERDMHGRVVGEAYVTLPENSSLDALTAATDGRYLLAGSVLPDRFDDADIFVKDVKLRTVSLPPRLVSAAMTVAADPLVHADTDSDPLDRIAEADVDDGSLVEPVGSPDPAALGAPNSAPLVEIDPSVEMLADTEPAPTSPDGLTDTAAALSRFVNGDSQELSQSTVIETDSGVQAQCRFSCLEDGNRSVSFPMWRAIKAPQSAFDLGLPAVHELTCRAAGGIRNISSKPDCTSS
ncbi:MAG: hypothetical protein L3J02_03625, partial [Henriciella sp.]|nr:hypothetical protein [Henriciella sp.]